MTPPAKFTESLAAFFDRHPMVEDAQFSFNGTDFTTIKVHFDDEFAMQDSLRLKYEAQLPTALCKSADVVSGSRSSILVVRTDGTYRVRGIEPNGGGTATLVLSKD